MSYTLTDYAREMIRRERKLGRIITASSFTTTAIVASLLATGTVSANKYKNNFAIRREAASQPADRSRIVTNFAASTGTFTHAGANYADTTATNEEVEVVEHDPYHIDYAIQQALKNTRFLDTHHIPTRNVDRVWLHDMTWVRNPSDIHRIYYRSMPVLSRNRYFDKWNTIGGSPDDWTLAGASAFGRIAGIDRMTFSLEITVAGGTDVTVTQIVGLLDDMAGSLRGKKVTAVLVGKTAIATSFLVGVTDGVSTVESSEMTADSVLRELSAELTIADTATGLSFYAKAKENGVHSLAQLYLVIGELTDGVRRDLEQRHFEYTEPLYNTDGPLQLILPRPYGYGGQIVVQSFRPYSGFDESHIAAGTADADIHDAPLELIAEHALYLLYSQVTGGGAIAASHWNEYQAMAAQHMYMENNGRGASLLPPYSGRSPVRV